MNRVATYNGCVVKKEDALMEFKWLNEGQAKTEGDVIKILAPAKSDFFFNNGAISEEGITPESLCNAPFYYT